MQQQEDWRISYVNKDFSVCSSYPSAVVVPKDVDDEILIAAASFRQGGRFPVLSYRHDGGVNNNTTNEKDIICIFLYNGNSLLGCYDEK